MSEETMCIYLSWHISKVLKIIPRFGVLLGGFIDSIYSHMDSYDLLQEKDTKQNQHKGKVHGATRHKLLRVLSQWSHTGLALFIFAAMSCDNM